MGRVFFFIREALRALRRNAAPSLAAVVTIVVTVLLLGVLIPVLYSTQSKTEDVREQISLKVYFFPEVDPSAQQVERAQEQIEATPHVTSVEYISKAEAKDILAARLHEEDDKDILDALPKGANPLPASFNVNIDDPNNLELVRSELAPPGSNGKPTPINPLFDDVDDSRSQASDIRAVTGAVKIVLAVIAALLLIASLMLVGNTIRLSIYARRREVEVMRLVGATSWLIRWPFIIEGLIVGFLGAASAVAILTIGKVTIVDPLADRFALVHNLDTVDFLPLVIALIACAMAVSALGSGITLRRFLRV
jgi:cell division transport system permease protein